MSHELFYHCPYVSGSGNISIALLSVEGFIKNTLIYVPKMNEGLRCLERNEGERLMTEFLFWGELTL